MAFSKLITVLISDGNGAMSKDFFSLTAEQWAIEHMQHRYGSAPPAPGDPEDHPAVMCYNGLVKEHRVIRGWFTKDGLLSPLMMSQTLARQLGGAIGSGYGWDFQVTGEPDLNMMQFKGTMIAVHRMLELKPRSTKLERGGAEIGGIAKLVRAAHMMRAESHIWTDIDKTPAVEVSSRWVSFRTFNFLVRSGVEPEWAWGMSKCREVFGPIDGGASILPKDTP